MAYVRTIWKNREVERPRTFEKIENPDGTITLLPSEGTIIEEGTPIIAETMNNIEDGIEAAHNAINEHKADNFHHIPYVVATGTNSYAVNIQGITALTEGMSIKVRFQNANTGTATLNINGLGAKEIIKSNGNSLSAGNIKAGQILHLVYTGSVFQLLGEGGEYGTAQPEHVLEGYTIGTEEGIKSGTMPNNGAINQTLTTQGGSYTIPAGYHNGSGKVTAYFANLVPGNIKQGVNVGGVIGTLSPGGYGVGDVLDPSKYLIAPEIWKFTGHNDSVYAVAVDKNGNVYSGGDDNTVRKISSSGNQVWSFTGHTSSVNAVAVDSNGYVYSGSDDGTVRKISSSGSQVWSFTGHTDRVRAVAVDSNGYVYSGSGDNTVKKISSSGNQVWSFTGHTDWVRAVAVDNKGNVYSGGDDNTVRKISSSGSEIWKFTRHTNYVGAVAVDNNGNVYSGSDDNTVRKISSSGNQVWSFTGHTSRVRGVAVDNNGNVYSGSYDKTVRKISSSGSEVWKFTEHTHYVSAVAVDNNNYIYSGSSDNTVRKIFDGIKIIA